MSIGILNTGDVNLNNFIITAFGQTQIKNSLVGVGEYAGIRIDPKSTNCCLTTDVESRYNKIYRNEILRFTFGGVGLIGTISVFIWFLIRLKKDKKADNCKFIKEKED